MPRKDQLITGEVYHIYNKSIAGFKIFNKSVEFLRVIKTICYYQIEKPKTKFSRFLSYLDVQKTENNIPEYLQHLSRKENKLVQIIAYCVMPTHIHLILKQLTDRGISIFMSNILNSYARYFNIKCKRKGPLWESRFKNAIVANDEYLMHLTRYIHLNPATANLVDNPEDWEFSSYNEYLSGDTEKERICEYSELLDVKPEEYKDFVDAQKDYQRSLAMIKHLTLD